MFLNLFSNGKIILLLPDSYFLFSSTIFLKNLLKMGVHAFKLCFLTISYL
jgi:hypothetical protein